MGSICHVKIKVFKGRVITFGNFIQFVLFHHLLLMTGSEEEVRNMEDQFLNEIYIHDFLREENTTSNDNTATDPHHSTDCEGAW